MELTIEALRQIVATRSYQTFFDDTVIDIQTANVLLLVYDALQREENKRKFEDKLKNLDDLAWLVDFAWSRVTAQG